MKIAIVGAGWSGCHVALELAEHGHQVILLERMSSIFAGVSGQFGIRLHKGPHYPRSRATREACLATFERFCARYPQLVVEHDYSIYAQGRVDATGRPSKVSNQVFASVCHESEACYQVDLQTSGFTGIEAAYNLYEPSIALGERLRSFFTAELNNAGVEVRNSCEIVSTQQVSGQQRLLAQDGWQLDVDRVINATGYQSLVSRSLDVGEGVDMEVVYQVCIGLEYEDSQPSQKPFSFIVMDGWFPCLMPLVESESPWPRNYVLTHGSYTILGSFARLEQAETLLQTLDDGLVTSLIRPFAEQEMCRFWAAFSPRFRYTGWKGVVQAKLKTRSEFRGSVVFQQGGVIHVFPGKISNVLQAGDEVIALLGNDACLEHNGLCYVAGGVLDSARQEIRNKPLANEQNTANLQTYKILSA
ncbi:FAD-dependent oxidoreductase [Pseudomonas vranovensis]|uniref:FAD-dependent oxidoreductase n=1 Tax=Pseudomonas vranovensis TaxID=321661 RepID=UPI003D99FE52